MRKMKWFEVMVSILMILIPLTLILVCQSWALSQLAGTSLMPVVLTLNLLFFYAIILVPILGILSAISSMYHRFHKTRKAMQ